MIGHQQQWAVECRVALDNQLNVDTAQHHQRPGLSTLLTLLWAQSREDQQDGEKSDQNVQQRTREFDDGPETIQLMLFKLMLVKSQNLIEMPDVRPPAYNAPCPVAGGWKTACVCPGCAALLAQASIRLQDQIRTHQRCRL